MHPCLISSTFFAFSPSFALLLTFFAARTQKSSYTFLRRFSHFFLSFFSLFFVAFFLIGHQNGGQPRKCSQIKGVVSVSAAGHFPEGLTMCNGTLYLTVIYIFSPTCHFQMMFVRTKAIRIPIRISSSLLLVINNKDCL